jgi:hypothetical protein
VKTYIVEHNGEIEMATFWTADAHVIARERSEINGGTYTVRVRRFNWSGAKNCLVLTAYRDGRMVNA